MTFPLLVSVLFLAGPAQEPARRPLTPEEEAGHRRMLEAVAAIRASVAKQHPFLETRTLPRVVERSAQESDPEQRLELLSQAAAYALREGKVRDAVAHLGRALALVPEVAEERRKELELRLEYELGVAWMRLGTTNNCIKAGRNESCMLPPADGMTHMDHEGSRTAIEHFRRVLALAPAQDQRSVGARWLLNIAYMTIGGYPADVPEAERIDPEVFRSRVPFPRFEENARELGLDNQDISGSVISADFDHDGDLDLLTCCWDPREDLHYWESEGGAFTERGAEARLEGIAGGLHMVPTDHDGDGELDVLVLRGAWLGGQGRYVKSLLRGLGDGSFVDVTFAAGLGTAFPSQTAAWLDHDMDGDLDVFVGNEATQKRVAFPSELFRNEGDGRFTDIAAAAGVRNERWAKGVTAGDYDDDGWPDLYVSNIYSANRLYHNRGDGTFEDVAGAAGVTAPERSFSTWFWDYDNDGKLDLYVSQYSGQQVTSVAGTAVHYLGLPAILAEKTTIYRGDGRGGFRDLSHELGVDWCPQPMGSGFGDLDNDGFLDFYLATGLPSFEGLMPNVMFRNDGGKRFDDVTFAGGFGHLQKGHGVSFCDLDNDGDQDVFTQMGGAFAADGFGDVLYENPGFGNHWLRLTLVGQGKNRAALGARVRVVIREDDAERSIWRDVSPGSSFGNNPLTLHIGLGRATRAERIEVRWPRRDAQPQVFENVPGDRHLRLVEGSPEPEEVREKVAPLAVRER